MKRELIEALFQKFEAAASLLDGIECWSARQLQDVLGYAKWQNFQVVLKKAAESCQNAGQLVEHHFTDVSKMIETGKGARREVKDIALTRYACYLIAQNGDPAKSEIAFAQTYFAVQTRKQELIEQRMLEQVRVSARDKLSKSEKKLSAALYERGVDDIGFARVRSRGDQALFGGASTLDMKRRLGVPENRPLADFLPTLTIKAKDFAAELTSHNVQEKDLFGEDQISGEHVENNQAVRRILGERGVSPENLPPAEDVQKVRRRLETAQKNSEKELPKAARKP